MTPTLRFPSAVLLAGFAGLALLLAACGSTAPPPAEAPAPAIAISAAAPAAVEPAAPAASRVAISWDRWGIPHIRAEDRVALSYGYGWAQAHNHAELLVSLVGRARARGSEIWGEDELADDVWLRTVGLPEWTRRSYATLDPEMRRSLDAFAAGVNDYLAAHPEALSERTATVLPVSGEDLIAHLGAIGLRFSQAREQAEGWRRVVAAGAGAEEAASLAPRAPLAERATASNAWALGPQKSASGHPLLLANPHLPWSGNLTWIEAHLTTPEVDVYGASLVGMPVIAIGFTDRLAWTHTVNTQDTEDLYLLALEGDGYRFAGEVRPFERRTETLRVRTEDGFRDEEIELLASVHGPVLAREGEAALALRRVDAHIPGLGAALDQWWRMARADDFDAFVAALETNAILGQNITYADADGTIAFFYGGVTPRRPRGDSDFWAGLLPGDDPELVWTELHPFADMPRVVDPPAGWVQNANDPPWYATFPPALDPDDYPPHLAPRRLPLRPQQSIELLLDSGRLTFEETIALKHSTEVEAAERLLPDLAAAVAAAGDEAPAIARRAADVLAAWDRATEAGSRGAVLFAAWVGELARRHGGSPFFAREWDESAPLETPAGLADPEIAVAALAAAAAEVEATHGRLDVAWGEVNRLRLGDRDLPGNGGPGGLGVFRVTYFAGVGAPGEEVVDVALGGDSYVSVVELAPEGPRAQALLSYGNASQEGSTHRGDQLPLYAGKSLREVAFSAAEVAAATVEESELEVPALALVGAGGTVPGEDLWQALAPLCGRAFAGRVVEGTEPSDATIAEQPLLMWVRDCGADEIRIPFHVGDDRSRTWVLTRTPAGVHLHHDHRHADGVEDAISRYGGHARGAATGTTLEFPADHRTAALLPAAATNVWTVGVDPGKSFTYALRREAEERRFRVEFDLARPVPVPAP